MLRTCVCCLTKGGSLCCGIFSFLGALFLTILGILLTYQFDYIHIEHPEQNHERASTNAYGAAIVYAVIMCVCIGFYFKHSHKEALGRKVSQHGLELEDISVPLMPSDHAALHGEIYRRPSSNKVTTT